jgi:hypothetical protein
MRIEDGAHGSELSNVIVAERRWNERQLIAYTAAHRGLRVVWTSSTRKTWGTRCFISGILDEDSRFGPRGYAIRDGN